MSQLQDIDEKLQAFVKEYGFTIPDRGLDKYGPGSSWRHGKPDYRSADLLYFEGKSKNHPPGSLESAVENLVKAWEMEVSHLPPKDWKVTNSECYTVQVNGGEAIDGEESARVGTYNWLMANLPKDVYDAQSHTFETSHALFRGAFVGGFPWEVLEVFSGPPRVGFTWRHWGTFNGVYDGRAGEDQVIELYGFTIATVDSNFKIEKLEVYSKPEGFIKALQGKLDPSELSYGKEFLGSCCPIHQTGKK